MNAPVLWRSWAQRSLPWRRTFALNWHRHLGRPAWVGLALLAVLLLLQGQLRPLLLRDQSRLETRRAALAAMPASPRAADAALSRSPLPDGDLPSARQRGRDLEWLVTAAQRSGLGLERADYSLGTASAGAVTRVEATLPLTGTYAGLRRFVAEVLNELPHSALESLQIERATAQSAQLQATARLVLFYGEEAR
jgi:hypothetical protein